MSELHAWIDYCSACGRTDCDGCMCAWCEGKDANFLLVESREQLCRSCAEVAKADLGKEIITK